MINVKNKDNFAIYYPICNNHAKLPEHDNKFLGSKNATNLNLAPASIAFKGYVAEPKLRADIKKLVDIVKDESVKKIAFLAHSCPDCDAIGSMIAGKHIIEKATGKVADIFTLKSIPENAKSLDPEGKNIIALKEAFEGPIKNTDIIKKYGQYDLVIVTDSPYISRIDKKLSETILKNAKKVAKIDHHTKSETESVDKFYFGDVNIISENKESASQIIMQLVKPMGLDPKKVDPKISNAISLGMLDDSGQLAFAKGADIYNDAAKLAKTSNLNKISNETKAIGIDEFSMLANLLGRIKFSENKDVAYMVVPKELTSMPIKNAVNNVMEQIRNIRGIKYYFVITEDASTANKFNIALRSKEKPISAIANKYNGGGHALASGFSINTAQVDNFIDQLVKELANK